MGSRRTEYSGHYPDVAYNPTDGEYLVVWLGDDDASPLSLGDIQVSS